MRKLVTQHFEGVSLYYFLSVNYLYITGYLVIVTNSLVQALSDSLFWNPTPKQPILVLF